MALNPLFSLPRIRQRLARAVARRTRAYRARIRRLLPWGARPDAVDPAGTQD
jgi:hypothetical protein